MERQRTVKCVLPKGVFIAIAAVVFALPAPARADNGPACVQAMVRSVDQVSAVHGIAFRDCARQSALGRLPDGLDFAGCLVRKDEGAFRRHALDGTIRREAQSCVPAPAVGYVGSTDVNRVASEWEVQMAGDVYGASIADALVPADANYDVSACQLAAMRGYSKLRSLALDGLARCLRARVAQGAEWSATTIAGCIDGGDAEELTRLERAEAVFRNVLTNACAGATVAEAFPGKCSGAATMADATACMVAPARCRTCRMAEAALGVAANCETYDNGKADGSCPAHTSACGNGTAEAGEECDSADFLGKSCTTFGFARGDLQCTSLCAISTAGCTHCGDGVVGQDEQCDTENLAGATCGSLGFHEGTISCDDQCRFDTSGCTVCGDALIGGSEQCDGQNLAGQTCASQGFDVGNLACSPECQFDTSACYRCGDGRIDPNEQCEGSDLAGQTCQSLGLVGGQLRCDACQFDTSLCFSDCNQGVTPPADLKFVPGDEMWLIGDSITAEFHQKRYHYGAIVLKVLGSSYCSFTDGFEVNAVGRKGSTYARYASYVRHYLPDPVPSRRRWVMFEDFGKTVKLRRARFEDAVRNTFAATKEVDPNALILFGTTPGLEESPQRPGICRYYQSVCNFAAHNDIVTARIAPELGFQTVPWDQDFCRLLVHRPSLLDLVYTSDGIHPLPLGELGLALSILKWSGVPRQDLVLSGLETLDPALTLAESEEVADWIYDPTTYDCTQLLEPCGEPGYECVTYLARNKQ